MTEHENTAGSRGPAPAGEPVAPILDALLAGLAMDTAPVIAAMTWAEQEIAAATRRHPEHADALYHAFALLLPRGIDLGMGTEFVYRSHVRELLERVAAGTDLRPVTAAELCVALAAISARTPLHGPGAGLYLRLWTTAFPDSPLTAENAKNQIHYERLHGPAIDEREAVLRRALRDPDRQRGDITCSGHHHGAAVHCSFALH